MGLSVITHLVFRSVSGIFSPTFFLSVSAMSAGHAHSAFVSSIGELFMVGSNHFGQLGIGDGEIKKLKTPTRLRLDRGGGGGGGGAGNEDDDSIKNRVTAVSCGLFHTLALVEEGSASVYTWGRPPIVLRSMMRGAQSRKHLSPAEVKVRKWWKIVKKTDKIVM